MVTETVFIHTLYSIMYCTWYIFESPLTVFGTTHQTAGHVGCGVTDQVLKPTTALWLVVQWVGMSSPSNLLSTIEHLFHTVYYKVQAPAQHDFLPSTNFPGFSSCTSQRIGPIVKHFAPCAKYFIVLFGKILYPCKSSRENHIIQNAPDCTKHGF